MKSLVASFFLVGGIVMSSTNAGAQTTHQGPRKQRARDTPPAASLKICQGLAIPDGYIIVAYVTSAACPHGAYLLKREDPSSRVSDPVRRGTTEPVASSKPASSTSQAVASSKPVASGPQSVASSKSVSRPRRVVTSESEPEAPSLRGLASPPPRRPPTLADNKPTTTTTPVNSSPDAVPTRDEEEVGEGDVVRIDTNLVTVPVSVMDREGRFVANLQREDFSVFENGIEQKIAYFEPTEKPFTVALMLDTSASTHFHLWEIKEAAINFAKQLRPQDRVLVVTFNDEVLVLTEVTNDLNVISAVIEENANTGDSTRLYDAVELVIKERLNKIKGRKAIVLFTDGVDTASYMADYQSTLHEAEELDALIYPIQYDTSDYARAMQNGGANITIVTSTSSWPFPSRSSSQVIYSGPSNGIPLPGTTKADYDRADHYLRELANKTGARLFQANDPKQLAQAFSGIAEELRRQYSLGYYPQTPDDQRGDRSQIKVRVRQPNLVVRARDSYLRRSSAIPAQ